PFPSHSPCPPSSPPRRSSDLRAGARASSSAEGHPPALAVNENIRDWWASDGPGRGHWIEIEMDGGHQVHAIQVNLADHELADYRSEEHTSELQSRFDLVCRLL